jgi:molybdate transport system substrate-binding protein
MLAYLSTARAKAFLLVAGLMVLPLSVHAQEAITVFAAASLKNALDDANAAWTKAGKGEAITSFAASSALAKQIEAGAPADIFISADLDWMSYLQSKDLVDQDHRAELLGNELVLITNDLNAKEIEISRDTDFAALLGSERLALAAVDTVPAGKYAKAAFEKFGRWDELKDKVASTENVRAALLLVSRGEAPYGVVYRSDAVADKAVKVIGTFPAGSHPAIVYPIAVIKGSKNPDASDYFNYLISPEAAQYFEQQGFTVIAKVGH